jgi:thiol-disulfide isomerase/thioredoxin
MKRRALLLAGLGGAVSGRAAPPGAPIDWPLIELLDGTRVEPGWWAGHAAVIVFWATWCPFCKRHNEHVTKLYRASREQPLRVLGIALDTDADLVRRAVAERGYRFPVALDSARLHRQLTSRRVVPMTCVIDRQGRLLQAVPGEMFEEDVLELGRLAQRGAA